MLMRFFLLSLIALLVACGSPSTKDAAPASDGPAAAAESEPASADDGFGLKSSRAGDEAPIPQGAPSGVGLAYEFPADWRPEEPSSSMRFAQAVVPGPGGDGEISLFFFGVGGGGGVEANLARWVGQVDAAPGTTPERGNFAAGKDLNITWVAVNGTLKAGGMGMGPATDQPNSSLFGAVAVGVGGPWFIKVTGPEATLKAQREPILTFLKSLKRKKLDKPAGAP
jgi:hypothetical protein